MLSLNLKSLLPKKAIYWDALINSFSKSKPRFSNRDFKRLKLISIILGLSLFLTGYQPVFNFPPAKLSLAAAAPLEQNQEIEAKIAPEFKLPHPGYLSNPFSNWHPGIDLATGLGMPIHPIAKGVVIDVDFGFFGYGNHIIISHEDGWKSLYAHMGRIFAKKGQIVDTENILGEVGLTGHTSGPHTHIEITHFDKAIDPLAVLPEIQKYPSMEYLRVN